MMKEVGLCIREFDKKTYAKFRNTFSSLDPTKIVDSDISLHNKYVLEKTSKTQANRVIANGLLFLLPSSSIQVTQIYDLLLKLSSLEKLSSCINRAIKHVRQVLAENTDSLNAFAAIFNQQKISWVHFLALGTALNKVESEEAKKAVMSAFINLAPQLDKTKFTHISPFISSITPNLFFQYVRPFLDFSMLRNAEKVVPFLAYFITPLQFSIFYFPKRSVSCFVETLSSLCESHDAKFSEQCSLALQQIAPHISPRCFLINSKSSKALFSSIEISRVGVKFALEQLTNKQLNFNARECIKTYIVRALTTQSFNDIITVDGFVSQWVLPENDFSVLYFTIDDLQDKSAALRMLKSSDQMLAKASLFKLGQYEIKSTDLGVTFTSKTCKEMHKIDVLAYTDILYRTRDIYPDLVIRSLSSLLSFSKHPEIIISCFKKCISCSNNPDFINGVINAFRIRKPTDLLSLELSQEFIDKLTISQKTIVFAAGYTISDDDPEIVTGLFAITDNYWQKGINKALSILAGRKNSHERIVIEVMKRKDKWDLNYSPIISSLIKSFNVKTDRELIEEVFHKDLKNLPPHFCVNILEKLPQYKASSKLFVNIFKTLSTITQLPREKIYSLFPLKGFTEFDFILLYPTMKYLLSVSDYISRQVSKIVGQFAYIDFKHTEVFHEMTKNGDQEAIAKFLIADQLKEFSDSDVAFEVISSKFIAEKAFALIENNQEPFKNTCTACVLSIYGLYSSCLPDFKEYLHIMVGYYFDHNVKTSEAIAQAMENYPEYSQYFNRNVLEIVENSVTFTHIAVEIFSYLSTYKNMGREIANYLFSLKLQDYDPLVFDKACIPKVSTTYADKTIDFFLSKPDFKHVDKEMFCCIESALKYSQKPVRTLISSLESYSNGDISDNTIVELIKCFDILHDVNKKEVEEHADRVIKTAQDMKPNIVALNFHFAPIPNRLEILRGWMTGKDKQGNKRGIETLKYVFLNPLEKENANSLLQELFKYCDNANADIVQGANGALVSAATTLGKSTLDTMIPSTIAMITSQLSRKSEQALVNVLLIMGKRFPDLMLNHLDQLISCFLNGNMRVETMNPFLKFMEKTLLDSDYSPLLRYTFVALHNNSKPIEVINMIQSHLDLVNEDQKVCLTIFQLIQNYLLMSDQNVKLSCFAILAELDLPDDEIGKAVDLFISMINGTIRKQIIPYFRKFINKISKEKKMHVYNELIKTGEALTTQSNGFSLLFGCIIAELNEPKMITLLLKAIDATTNTFYRDSLLVSIEQLCDISTSSIITSSDEIVKCVFNQIANNTNIVQRLLLRLLELLNNEQLYTFASLINVNLCHEKASVRDACVNILIAMQKQKKLTQELFHDDIYKSVLAAINILKNDELIKDQKAKKIYNYFDPKIIQSLYSTDFDFEKYIGRFLRMKELVPPTIITCADIFNNYNDLTLIKDFIKNWSQLEDFDEQYSLLIQCSELTTFGLNITVIAINIINEVNEKANPFELKNQPKVNLSISTISLVSKLLINIDTKTEQDEKFDGVTYIYPFFFGYFNIIKSQPLNANPIYDIFTELSRLLHFKSSKIPARSMSPQGIPPPAQSNTQKTSSGTMTRSLSEVIPKGISKVHPMLRQYLEKAFENIGTMYSGREIFGLPIDNKVVLQLLLNIANKNPKFFVSQQVTTNFYSHLFSLLLSSQSDEPKNIILSLINNLKDVEDFMFFITNMTNFFLNFKVNQNNRSTIIPDNIIQEIIKRFLKSSDDYLYQIAMFFMASFSYIKESTINEFALKIVQYMLSPLVNKFPFSEFYDTFTTISLFLPYVRDQSFYIATLMSCLNYASLITTSTEDLRCDLLTVVDTVLSNSTSPQLVIQILLQHVTSDKRSSIILESIAHALSFPASLKPDFLSHVWSIASKFLSDDYSIDIKCFVAKIGAEIINCSNNEDSFSICRKLFLYQKIEIQILSAFVSTLNRHDKLEWFVFQDARKFLLEKNKIIELIPLIPIFYERKLMTRIEQLTFLVRGLFSGGFAAPMMCYKELRALVPEIRKLDESDALVIVTGIYFASTSISQPYLRKYARETLTEIFTYTESNGEDAKLFREKYLENLDPSVKQAIQKDYHDLLTK